tara:strand:+ start:22 stop:669 length:648 start_codon:yes stop_codon:yes gene_type:complete
MPYGYVGDISDKIKQSKKNNGVLTVNEIADLKTDGNWGGTLQLIEEQTVSGTPTTVDFDDIKSDIFDVHFITFSKVEGESTTAQDLRMRVSNDGGSSFESGSSYHYATLDGRADGTFAEFASGGATTSFCPVPDLDKETYATLNGYVYLYSAGDSAKYTYLECQNILGQSAVGTRWRNGGGSYQVAETVDAIQFLTLSGGGYSGGTFKVYGVKQL